MTCCFCSHASGSSEWGSTTAGSGTVGPHGGLGRIIHPPVTTATGCSTVERIGVGLDFSLPLINTGARDLCDTTDSATGQALTVAAWVLQLLAWAFAALFIAGFTSAVRKT
jgi:hypothetical protein